MRVRCHQPSMRNRALARGTQAAAHQREQQSHRPRHPGPLRSGPGGSPQRGAARRPPAGSTAAPGGPWRCARAPLPARAAPGCRPPSAPASARGWAPPAVTCCGSRGSEGRTCRLSQPMADGSTCSALRDTSRTRSLAQRYTRPCSAARRLRGASSSSSASHRHSELGSTCSALSPTCTARCMGGAGKGLAGEGLGSAARHPASRRPLHVVTHAP